MSESLHFHPGSPPQERILAKGRGWSVGDVVCTLGPQDRPFEEQHREVSIGVVLSGTFSYRSPAGDALLYPGALMLGNPGACFECGHEHASGDHCLALRLDPGYFGEIAATAAGSSRFRFRTGLLPSLRTLTPVLARLQTAGGAAEPAALESAAVQLVEGIVAELAGPVRGRSRLSPRDRRRISESLDYIERHVREPLNLDELAAAVCMSKYHFLRTFRRVTGVTPHQYLINCRLRRAATALRAGAAPVSEIAYAEGFPDLSGFNGQFRQTFGMSPRNYRNSA